MGELNFKEKLKEVTETWGKETQCSAGCSFSVGRKHIGVLESLEFFKWIKVTEVGRTSDFNSVSYNYRVSELTVITGAAQWHYNREYGI